MTQSSLPRISPDFWQNKTVLVTGHTGFIGGWMCHCLDMLGAKPAGLALPAPKQSDFFDKTDIRSFLTHHHQINIQDAGATRQAIIDLNPDIVIHLAAQPIVRHAFQNPLESYSTNVMGTAHVLEAIRALPTPTQIVAFTTDKVYDNQEWVWGYRESDPLGGKEPYGTSKAACEMVLSGYYHSYFKQADTGLAIIRAGNVIGGGDWAQDRLIPDAMRAFMANETVTIRNPHAVRPWQHVCEPILASLLLCQALAQNPADYSGPWNIGPDSQDFWPVGDIMEKITEFWRSKNLTANWHHPDHHTGPYEATLLAVDSAKIRQKLHWSPILSVEQALSATVDWYHAYGQQADLKALTRQQLSKFLRTDA